MSLPEAWAVLTLVLICLAVSVRKMEELGSLALILVWAPAGQGRRPRQEGWLGVADPWGHVPGHPEVWVLWGGEGQGDEGCHQLLGTS